MPVWLVVVTSISNNNILTNCFMSNTIPTLYVPHFLLCTKPWSILIPFSPMYYEIFQNTENLKELIVNTHISTTSIYHQYFAIFMLLGICSFIRQAIFLKKCIFTVNYRCSLLNMSVCESINVD